MNSLIRNWDLVCNNSGELIIGGCNSLELSQLYDTPLHIVNERRLEKTANDFIEAMKAHCNKSASAHFAFKCNPVPGILKIIKNAGLKAEVMSEPELELALKLGYEGHEIVVNGPYKTDKFIAACIRKNVRLINIDSLFELERIDAMCNLLNKETDVLFRINPDYIPSGMNKGSATGGRLTSPFGLDLKGGEVAVAINRITKMGKVRFKGFHFHIGSGILNTDEYRKALHKLKGVVDDAEKLGLTIDVMDVGGGLGVSTSREMTTTEMLLYQAFDHLPSGNPSKQNISFEKFTRSVRDGVTDLFGNKKLPEILFEPGRCITSSNQLLLLAIHQVKQRKGAIKWLITNGGIGTSTMPTFYENHEVILCNDVNRHLSEKVTISGPGCFAADIVYRNKKMPEVGPGEILAVMDSGAYFTSWESSFGFPRPAIVSVKDGQHTLIRRRESFDDMFANDTY